MLLLTTPACHFHKYSHYTHTCVLATLPISSSAHLFSFCSICLLSPICCSLSSSPDVKPNFVFHHKNLLILIFCLKLLLLLPVPCFYRVPCYLAISFEPTFVLYLRISVKASTSPQRNVSSSSAIQSSRNSLFLCLNSAAWDRL